MFDITKWFKKESQIDVNVLQSSEKDELLKIAKDNKINVDDKAEKGVIIEAIKKFVESKRKEDGPDEEKVYQYMCREECVYLGKFRKAGDIITLPERKEIPHFVYVEFGKREEEKN